MAACILRNQQAAEMSAVWNSLKLDSLMKAQQSLVITVLSVFEEAAVTATFNTNNATDYHVFVWGK